MGFPKAYSSHFDPSASIPLLLIMHMFAVHRPGSLKKKILPEEKECRTHKISQMETLFRIGIILYSVRKSVSRVQIFF